LHCSGFAGQRRIALIGLQHRARLRVVGNQRPEVIDRDIWRKMKTVGLSTVKIVALRIHCDHRILRSAADDLHGHCRRNPAREKEETGARIKQPSVVPDELMAAANEGLGP
jgi:hypothetical protein